MFGLQVFPILLNRTFNLVHALPYIGNSNERNTDTVGKYARDNHADTANEEQNTLRNVQQIVAETNHRHGSTPHTYNRGEGAVEMVNGVALIISSSGASTKMYGTMNAAIASLAAITPVRIGLAPAIPAPA